MKQYICVSPCVHGKLWKAGQKATEAQLKPFGEVPKYFEEIASAKVKKAGTSKKEADKNPDPLK